MNNDIIIRFLKNSGMELLANPENYELFDTMQKALEADDKPTFNTVEVDAFFAKSISSVNDLFENQGQILNGMLECNIRELTDDLYTSLRDDLNIVLSAMVGGLWTITTEMYVDNDKQTSLQDESEIKAYIANLNNEDKQALKELLADWQNTFALMVDNSDVWFEALGIE